VGSPFLYRTTPDFLIRFGLKDIGELPRPEELAEDLAATVADPSVREPMPEAHVAAEAIPITEEEEEPGPASDS
jgi:segregation and condensation protein B